MIVAKTMVRVERVNRIQMEGDFDSATVQVMINHGTVYVCLPGKGWFAVLVDKYTMREYAEYVRGDPSNPQGERHGIPPREWYEAVVEAARKAVE